MKTRGEIRKFVLACLGSFYLMVWLGGAWVGAFVVDLSVDYLVAWVLGGVVLALALLPITAFFLGRPNHD